MFNWFKNFFENKFKTDDEVSEILFEYYNVPKHIIHIIPVYQDNDSLCRIVLFCKGIAYIENIKSLDECFVRWFIDKSEISLNLLNLNIHEEPYDKKTTMFKYNNKSTKFKKFILNNSSVKSYLLRVSKNYYINI